MLREEVVHVVCKRYFRFRTSSSVILDGTELDILRLKAVASEAGTLGSAKIMSLFLASYSAPNAPAKAAASQVAIAPSPLRSGAPSNACPAANSS
jgi:hypothetical protein